MQPLQKRVLDLRHDFTAYDAMYVALAEVLDMPLLTDDGKFASTPGHRADIHAYPD
ncbi:type II toxin-antitoxin system VapC family toxin [Actinomadura alba]|uniref:type II toxin-antitoxin system VapC family toxin n=1 Tax=Actinomadura alba TaxID=406431 RepID=UPI0031E06D3B